MKRIAIIYLSFYHEPRYIERLQQSLAAVTYPHTALELVVVDNPHPSAGSWQDFLSATLLPQAGITLPAITILPQAENLGFAHGNNAGLRYALEKKFDYIYFLNNDAYPLPGTFEPLVAALEDDPAIGLAQSLIVLEPNHERINSSGNLMHFLGFGYCRDYEKLLSERIFLPVEDVAYASGAALMVPARLAQRFGGWDPDFFMYHEDMEWSLRLKSLGYRVVLVSASVVCHEYEFSRSLSKYFWMERNRFALWLMYWRWLTLLLFLPAAVLCEIGLYIFSWKNGFWREKHQVYKYWLQASSWDFWLTKREKIQKQRSIPDRVLARSLVGYIKFQGGGVDNPVVRYIANPILSFYLAVAKRLLLW